MSVCNAMATFMQILGGFVGVTLYAARSLRSRTDLNSGRACCSAGVVFESRLRRDLAMDAPGVDAGPLTESVTAIYAAVSSTARPAVLRAYVNAVRTPPQPSEPVSQCSHCAGALCHVTRVCGAWRCSSTVSFSWPFRLGS